MNFPGDSFTRETWTSRMARESEVSHVKLGVVLRPSRFARFDGLPARDGLPAICSNIARSASADNQRRGSPLQKRRPPTHDRTRGAVQGALAMWPTPTPRLCGGDLA